MYLCKHSQKIFQRESCTLENQFILNEQQLSFPKKDKLDESNVLIIQTFMTVYKFINFSIIKLKIYRYF